MYHVLLPERKFIMKKKRPKHHEPDECGALIFLIPPLRSIVINGYQNLPTDTFIGIGRMISV
uniref:Uncharacterized protein n=1 Tax=Anopheles funestus TaxID=62324 RepID=A0A182S3Y0_ANOFN